jgi:hypothetical protein
MYLVIDSIKIFGVHGWRVSRVLKPLKPTCTLIRCSGNPYLSAQIRVLPGMDKGSKKKPGGYLGCTLKTGLFTQPKESLGGPLMHSVPAICEQED